MIQGAYGNAVRVTLPDTPEASETVCLWLMTLPQRHPFWSQYILLVLRLTDGKEGFPPPHHDFIGSTHELLVLAVDPTNGVTTLQSAEERAAAGKVPVPFLMGPNVVQQAAATDEEMALFAELAARAVVDGHLDPESGDAPDRVRESWLTVMVKTLAHFRGEERAP